MLNRSITFAKKLELRWPVIIQAPMAGGITTPSLVATVSNKDCLGSFATGYLPAEKVRNGIREIKALTKKAFAVNLFIPNKFNINIEQARAYQHLLNNFRRKLKMAEEDDLPSPLLPKDNLDNIVDILLEEEIRIISFTFGTLPKEYIRRFKNKNVYLIGTATSLDEAKILADQETDAIIVQGHEAGGHRGGFFTPERSASIGNMALIPSAVDAVKCPVIAAGGIMDGRGIIAAIALGAAGVQMGTAFLTTKESGANSTYKEELCKAKTCNDDATTLTKAYSGKLARGLQTDFIKTIEESTISIPSYPTPHYLSTNIRKEAANQKQRDMMSMWSGQGVPLIRQEISTEKFLDELFTEVDTLLSDISTSQLKKKI
ncbi:MAG TPA: nitronate monooxygenase [Gammaproteobacteria bacterium]|nr:nitronate monooxygenase [Gammaproteobacteria bacterium]